MAILLNPVKLSTPFLKVLLLPLESVPSKKSYHRLSPREFGFINSLDVLIVKEYINAWVISSFSKDHATSFAYIKRVCLLQTNIVIYPSLDL